jgi:ribose/xylose/arabinose/galactoside ABC-type transport system permease subunit
MNALRRIAARGLSPDLIANNVLLLALVALCAYFTTRSSVFLTVGNAKVIAQNNGTLGIIVVAMAFLVITGCVDLSMGSTVGLSSTLTALASVEWGMPGLPAIAIGLLAGLAVGVVNGALCGLAGFNPVIVTLGMLGAVRGLTLLIHHDQVFGLDPMLTGIAATRVAGVPLIAVIALLVMIAGGVFLRLTVWGPYLFAIGANRDAAFLAGLPVRALPFAMYVVSGGLSGVAGVLLAARLNGSAPGQQGINLEMEALTVVLLGGVAFAGGRGRLSGVITGWVFLGVLENGLTLTNVSPFAETLVQGIALIMAAGLEAATSFLAPRLADRSRLAERSTPVEPAPILAPSGSVATSEVAS